MHAVLTSRLYPYGKSSSDAVLYGTDDGATEKVYLGSGFLFYGRFVSNAYVSLKNKTLFPHLFNNTKAIRLYLHYNNNKLKELHLHNNTIVTQHNKIKSTCS